jgi:hypothetical protein
MYPSFVPKSVVEVGRWTLSLIVQLAGCEQGVAHAIARRATVFCVFAESAPPAASSADGVSVRCAGVSSG